MTLSSTPRRVITATWDSDNVGYVFSLCNDTNRCIRVEVNNDAIRMALVARRIDYAPGRFSVYTLRFLFRMNCRFFRINLVFFGEIAFEGRIRVIRTVMFSARFLRRFGANVRFLFNGNRNVDACIPKRNLYTSARLIATFYARYIPPNRNGFRPVLRFLTRSSFLYVMMTMDRQIFAFFSFGFGLSCAKGMLFLYRGFRGW